MFAALAVAPRLRPYAGLDRQFGERLRRRHRDAVGPHSLGPTGRFVVDHAPAPSCCFDRLRTERHAVSAVLTRDARDAASPMGLDGHQVWAGVRRRGPGGSMHAGQAGAPANARAGDRGIAWTDERGASASAPPRHGEGEVEAAILGTLAAGATAGAAWAGGRAVPGRLMERRMRAWEDEWARADLLWGGRTG